MRVKFVFADGSAVFEVTHFVEGREARGFDAPDPGEIELDEMGEFTADGADEGVTFPLNILIEIFMAYHKLDRDHAVEMINQEAYDDVMRQRDAGFDDRL